MADEDDLDAVPLHERHECGGLGPGCGAGAEAPMVDGARPSFEPDGYALSPTVSTKSGCHDSISEATAASSVVPLPKSPTTAKVNLERPAGAARNVPVASAPETPSTVYR